MQNLFHDIDLFSNLEGPSKEPEFLRNLASAYRDIYVSTMSIVGNRDDAEDVIQEVCVVLWQKYDEFQPGTNFRKWACAVAFNVSKAYARKQRQRNGFGLSEHTLMKVAKVRSAETELLELRQEVLRECLDKLSSEQRTFLAECYQTTTSIAGYAKTHGLSLEAVYGKLKRLRQRVTDCMNRSLGWEDAR